MSNQRKMLIYLYFTLLTAGAGCGLFDNEQPPGFFTVTPVSSVEAWLKIAAAPGDSLTVARNEQPLYSFRMNGQDTVLLDSGLAPATAYQWKAANHTTGESQVAEATPPDTTSHAYSWQVFQLGTETSTLSDAAIIEEDNIWVVGSLFLNDSLGQPDTDRYNAAHWDGQEWVHFRIPFDACGAVTYPEVKSIFSLETDNIWFVRGGSVTHYDENQYTNDCRMNELLNGSLTKIWGTSSTDLFVVGGGGTIVHYNGINWQKVESGTSTNLEDVYGNEESVFAVGYEDFKPTVLLKYSGGELTRLIDDTGDGYDPGRISGWMRSVWVQGPVLYVLTGYGLYRARLDSEGAAREMWRGKDLSRWGSARVRGTGWNNIVAAGNQGRVWHYNGATWHEFEQLYNPEYRLRSLAVTEETIVVVGIRTISGIEYYGVVAIGTRN